MGLFVWIIFFISFWIFSLWIYLTNLVLHSAYSAIYSIKGIFHLIFCFSSQKFNLGLFFFFFLPVLLRYDWYTTQYKVLGGFFFGVYLFLMATLAAYGSSWTGNWILAVAASYASNTRSLTSVPGRGLNLHPGAAEMTLIQLHHSGNSDILFNE